MLNWSRVLCIYASWQRVTWCLCLSYINLTPKKYWHWPRSFISKAFDSCCFSFLSPSCSPISRKSSIYVMIIRPVSALRYMHWSAIKVRYSSLLRAAFRVSCQSRGDCFRLYKAFWSDRAVSPEPNVDTRAQDVWPYISNLLLSLCNGFRCQFSLHSKECSNENNAKLTLIGWNSVVYTMRWNYIHRLPQLARKLWGG